MQFTHLNYLVIQIQTKYKHAHKHTIDIHANTSIN